MLYKNSKKLINSKSNRRRIILNIMILTLLESILLIVNAVAILNEKRFLKKCTSIDYVSRRL